MVTPSPADAAVEAAIAHVLSAERAANEDVERATREAAAIVDGARATARTVAERVERRLRRLRTAFETRAATDVAAIDAQAAAEDVVHELTPEDLARLDRAVTALARELTEGTR